jgi:hypothetical protein
MNRQLKIQAIKELAAGKKSLKDFKTPIDLSIYTVDELNQLAVVKRNIEKRDNKELTVEEKKILQTLLDKWEKHNNGQNSKNKTT